MDLLFLISFILYVQQWSLHKVTEAFFMDVKNVITMGCFEIAFQNGLEDLDLIFTSNIVMKEHYGCIAKPNITYIAYIIY